MIKCRPALALDQVPIQFGLNARFMANATPPVFLSSQRVSKVKQLQGSVSGFKVGLGLFAALDNLGAGFRQRRSTKHVLLTSFLFSIGVGKYFFLPLVLFVSCLIGIHGMVPSANRRTEPPAKDHNYPRSRAPAKHVPRTTTLSKCI